MGTSSRKSWRDERPRPEDHHAYSSKDSCIWDKHGIPHPYFEEPIRARTARSGNPRRVAEPLPCGQRKFGDSVRSKTDVAMKNEVLAKSVSHNIACVIQSAYELTTFPVACS